MTEALHPGCHPAGWHACHPPPAYRLDQVRPIAARSTRRESMRSRWLMARLAGSSSITASALTPTGVDRGGRRRPSSTRLTTLLLPGIGTVHDLERAYDLGVASVRMATHCTEADIAKQHIGAARELGMDVAGFLMMSHMSPPGGAGRAGQADGGYGAHCVYVTDSGGALTMDGRRGNASRPTVGAEAGETERGIHAHHNLSLGVANPSSPSKTARSGSMPRWRAWERARQCAARGLHRDRRPTAGIMAATFRADGRGRRSRAAAAGPAGARRPGDPTSAMQACTRASCGMPRGRRGLRPRCARRSSWSSAGGGWWAARRT